MTADCRRARLESDTENAIVCDCVAYSPDMFIEICTRCDSVTWSDVQCISFVQHDIMLRFGAVRVRRLLSHITSRTSASSVPYTAIT